MTKKQMTPLQQDIQNYEDQIVSTRDRLAKQFMEEIQSEMKRINLSRADLALVMDLERSQVSRLMNKPCNPTLRTLIGLASAVDHELSFELKPIHPVAQPSYPNIIPLEDWRGLLNTCVMQEPAQDQSELGWGIAGNGNR